MSNVSKKELRNNIATRLSNHLEVATLDEMPLIETLGERLANAGVSRRSFMKYCMGVSAIMADNPMQYFMKLRRLTPEFASLSPRVSI